MPGSQQASSDAFRLLSQLGIIARMVAHLLQKQRFNWHLILLPTPLVRVISELHVPTALSSFLFEALQKNLCKRGVLSRLHWSALQMPYLRSVREALASMDKLERSRYIRTRRLRFYK